MNIILGLITPLVVIILITILHYILPGRWITGYVTGEQSGALLRYRLNGLLLLIVSIGIWYGLGHYDIVDFTWLYRHRWWSLIGALILGLSYSLIMTVAYPSVTSSFIKDFYYGRAKNPQLQNGRIDHKMWLYIIGAVLLALHCVSFATQHIIMYGSSFNPGVFLATVLILWFILDYCIFEHVHLYTYDIFAERVGFKLGWGCLFFYPYFYSISLWFTVDRPNPDMNVVQLVISVIVFLAGWIMARGANMQKYYFKRYPERAFLGIQPKVITDGHKKILASGFWGVSRHINYLGEICMGLGIASAVGHYDLIWPWLYPLYYILLLVPRQLDDDKRCLKKYGKLWEEYQRQVPYRIIPGIY